jgi:hypothetical protein
MTRHIILPGVASMSSTLPAYRNHWRTHFSCGTYSILLTNLFLKVPILAQHDKNVRILLMVGSDRWTDSFMARAFHACTERNEENDKIHEFCRNYRRLQHIVSAWPDSFKLVNIAARHV